MKIVIETQVRENYAAHNGFTGEYAWKNKGGSTYVFPGLNWTDVEANQAFAKIACELVSENNDYFVEYVLDWSFEEDDFEVGHYPGDEVPHFTRNEDGTWTKFMHTTDAHYRWGMSESKKQWTLTADGEVVEGSYNAEYFHSKFGWINEKDIDYKLMDRIERKEEVIRIAERGSVFEGYYINRLIADLEEAKAA